MAHADLYDERRCITTTSKKGDLTNKKNMNTEHYER